MPNNLFIALYLFINKDESIGVEDLICWSKANYK